MHLLKYVYISVWDCHGYLMYKLCLGRILKNKLSKLTTDSTSKIFKYLSPIKLINKYCIWVFCIQFSVAMEIVNHKMWCSSSWYKILYSNEPTFLLTVPKRCFFCGSFLLFAFLVCLSYCRVCSLHAGKGLTSWLYCIWCFSCVLLLSYIVS